MKRRIVLALVLAMAMVSQAQDYTLVWNEDFTDGALDTKVWNIEVNGDGGGNNELQYYCEKGVSLGAEPTTGKQCLILTATKEEYLGKQCTSGRVNTLGKMTYTFGRIDARIKFPKTANGLWPAFWQMGNNFDQVGWPKCGETDIIEMGHQNAFPKGTQDRFFNGAMHVGRAWDAVWSDAQDATWSYSLQDTFHIVTMIWTPFIIANLAVGGNFPGIGDINKITALANGPRSMYIDWIRIYQKGDANQSFVSPSASDAIEPERAQGIEEVPSDQVPSTKVLRNGQLLIIRGEKVYTITGQILK